MTGYEALKEELIKRGFTKQQTEARIIPGVISVIAEDPRWLELIDIEDEIKRAKNDLYSEQYRVREAKDQLKREEEKRKALVESLKEVFEYLDLFDESLKKLETPEARDKLKLIQIFENSVDVQTPQNKSVYIAGLASIIAGASIPLLESIISTNVEHIKKSAERRMWREL